MDLQNSQKNQNENSEIYKEFFTVDLVDPDFYFTLKKEIFDDFIKNPELRFENPIYWRMNVFATWKYFRMLEPDDILSFAPTQVLTAVSLGYNVFDEFIYYLNGRNLIYENIVKLFYQEFRNRFLNSNEKIGMGELSIGVKELVKEIYFLSNKGENSQEFLDFKKRLEGILFSEVEKDPIYEYIYLYKEDSINGLIKLINLFNNVSQEQILEKLMEMEVSFNKTIQGEISESQNIDKKELLPKEDEISENLVKTEETKPIEKPVSTPTYSQIKSKILQFFPKDEAGDIVDIEGVFEVLEKTADKYGDPKIKELYYYNEATGKFEWGL